MATRKPLVLGANGGYQQLQAGDVLEPLGNAPLPFAFGGTGTPAVASVPQQGYVPVAATCLSLALSCGTAPTGNFTVVIKRSSDSGATFPDTIGTITIASGATRASSTTFSHASLAAGDWLRCDVSSASGAADWKVRLDTYV